MEKYKIKSHILDQIKKGADEDYKKQTKYDLAFDRKDGFIQGAKFALNILANNLTEKEKNQEKHFRDLNICFSEYVNCQRNEALKSMYSELIAQMIKHIVNLKIRHEVWKEMS